MACSLVIHIEILDEIIGKDTLLLESLPPVTWRHWAVKFTTGGLGMGLLRVI